MSFNTFKYRVYAALSDIPSGRVISYSSLAKRCGSPGGARAVAQVLANLPEDTRLPWHRVVNAQGKISFPAGSLAYERQYQLLTQEGISFTNNRINLLIYDYT